MVRGTLLKSVSSAGNVVVDTNFKVHVQRKEVATTAPPSPTRDGRDAIHDLLLRPCFYNSSSTTLDRWKVELDPKRNMSIQRLCFSKVRMFVHFDAMLVQDLHDCTRPGTSVNTTIAVAHLIILVATWAVVPEKKNANHDHATPRMFPRFYSQSFRFKRRRGPPTCQLSDFLSPVSPYM